MSSAPILVMMSWRGGDRLTRCLDSIAPAIEYFSRVVLSITATADSDDMRMALEFQADHPAVEVICTQRELPTMQHQGFWVDYLRNTGVSSSEWIYWLAYDDEVRLAGIRSITDSEGNWPLHPGHAYFGPWAMRHEGADQLWEGDPAAPLESWTSFPAQGPTALPVLTWIKKQLEQPTYMQMSGSVCEFGSYIDVYEGKPQKHGPMRIEMAVAAARSTVTVEEFPEPVSIIYGRSNSDRASYGAAARKEDVHLLMWLARHSIRHPAESPELLSIITSAIRMRIRSSLGRGSSPREQWRVRGSVQP